LPWADSGRRKGHLNPNRSENRRLLQAIRELFVTLLCVPESISGNFCQTIKVC
jgi:hypothetical protein